MSIPWGSVFKGSVPIIGSVAGAAIDKAAQDATNKSNAAMAREQMEFQRDQSATAYQRAVRDIAAAGLNPALAYNKGGADSGTGASSESRAPTTGQKLMQAFDAYNQFANSTAQRELIREQANTQRAITSKTYAETSAIRPQAYLGTDEDYIQAFARSAKGKANAEEYTARKSPVLLDANLRQTNQSTATARAQEQLLRTQATLNEQEFMTEWFRKNIAPYINNTAHSMKMRGAIPSIKGW